MPETTSGSGPDSIAYAAADDLAAVRRFVRDRALALGLAPDRVDLLALAVSELTTNTLQHTTGGGRVRVWREGGQLYCDVVDSGPDRTFGPMPSADSVRGRGLAIVHTVADEVTSSTVAGETRVRVRMAL